MFEKHKADFSSSPSLLKCEKKKQMLKKEPQNT